MPEAVIVAAARSPIGRARKGSLAEMRPDDLTVQMMRAALAQVPVLDPTGIDDTSGRTGRPVVATGRFADGPETAAAVRSRVTPHVTEVVPSAPVNMGTTTATRSSSPTEEHYPPGLWTHASRGGRA